MEIGKLVQGHPGHMIQLFRWIKQHCESVNYMQCSSVKREPSPVWARFSPPAKDPKTSQEADKSTPERDSPTRSSAMDSPSTVQRHRASLEGQEAIPGKNAMEKASPSDSQDETSPDDAPQEPPTVVHINPIDSLKTTTLSDSILNGFISQLEQTEQALHQQVLAQDRSPDVPLSSSRLAAETASDTVPEEAQTVEESELAAPNILDRSVSPIGLGAQSSKDETETEIMRLKKLVEPPLLVSNATSQSNVAVSSSHKYLEQRMNSLSEASIAAHEPQSKYSLDTSAVLSEVDAVLAKFAEVKKKQARECEKIFEDVLNPKSITLN